jgi:hypothetical protein
LKKRSAPRAAAKNFCSLRAFATLSPKPPENKSFFASFFAKKEALSYLQ